MKFGNWLKLSLALCIVLAIVGCSRVREVRDKNYSVIPGSIASNEQVSINGTSQWIYIRGVSRNNPVILWLDGGPGMPEVGLVRKHLAPLHNNFTVVCWDQRGFGRSADAARDLRTVKVSDYVQDVIVLSERLAKRFNQKIYLVGHDWGSVIGIAAASQRPDLYAAFVGISPRINTVETDRQLYESVVENAQRQGDLTVANRLKQQGPPPYTLWQTGRYALLFREAATYTPRFYLTKLDLRDRYGADEHDLIDRAAVRASAGYDYIYPKLAELDLETQIPALECPAFFVVGKYDFITPLSISQRYIRKLNAPQKDLAVFEASGHDPCFSEPDRFTAYMTQTVMAQTK